MRQRWLTAGVGFGVGAVMLFASGFSAMANTSGYDAYKAALKNTQGATSMTADVAVTITDNGTKLVGATSNIMMMKKPNAGSIAVTLDDTQQTHAFNVFRQDGKVILKSGDSDVYRVIAQPAGASQRAWTSQHDGVAAHPPKAVEQVFDALMGNMRELATVETASDGGKHAALHLSGSQIPAVASALGSVIAANLVNCDQWQNPTWNHAGNAAFPSSDMKVNMPRLTDNVKVETVDLDAKINPDQRLEQQTAEINITGTDDAGQPHVLAIQLRIDFSGFDNTAPARVDLTGKQTQDVQPKATHDWHH